jgi:hypothetical protein
MAQEKATAPTTARKTTVAKAAVKPAVKKTVSAKAPVTPPVAAPKTVAKPVKAEKPVKVKKPKLVRDSFTMPKDEYQVIDTLKTRGNSLGHPIKKSELLRAGIKALAAMSDIQFKATLSNVPTIKTGRPKSEK